MTAPNPWAGDADDIARVKSALRDAALAAKARGVEFGRHAFGVVTVGEVYEPRGEAVCLIGAYLIGKPSSVLGLFYQDATEAMGVPREVVIGVSCGWDAAHPSIAKDRSREYRQGWDVGAELARELMGEPPAQGGSAEETR